MPISLPFTSAWQEFSAAARTASRQGEHLRIIQAPGLRLDLTAQAHSEILQKAARNLFDQQGFALARAQLFDGGNVNWTENRAAWHTALRAPTPPASVARAIQTERERMRQFVEEIDADNRYSCVLHLGIGGSDWGPRMVTRALRHGGTRRTISFASNIDSHAVADALHGLDPHRTLVIVASKSFTTTEPLANAEVALNWLRNAGVDNPIRHIVAITANVEAALNFGISPQRIFQLWDWVGGRYSLWSTIGLPIALTLGNETFEHLLAGAAAMDQHFHNASFEDNAPLQMAIAGVVNRSVLGFDSLALAPYDSRLQHLVPWAQQLEMESLGKVATRDGTPVGVPTGPAVWGMPGTDCQHTFFQWLHQDAAGAPVDFIVCEQPDHPYSRHHKLLIANCLAQRAALLRGKSYQEALAETQQTVSDVGRAHVLAQHRIHPGGRPSSLIMLPRLDAYSLGALLALYEHKVFTQGVIWGINPFDQWGVEFGKSIAKNIVQELDAQVSPTNAQDISTRYWIDALAKQDAPSASS